MKIKEGHPIAFSITYGGLLTGAIIRVRGIVSKIRKKTVLIQLDPHCDYAVLSNNKSITIRREELEEP